MTLNVILFKNCHVVDIKCWNSNPHSVYICFSPQVVSVSLKQWLKLWDLLELELYSNTKFTELYQESLYTKTDYTTPWNSSLNKIIWTLSSFFYRWLKLKNFKLCHFLRNFMHSNPISRLKCAAHDNIFGLINHF